MKLIDVRYLTTSLALLGLALPACSSGGGGDDRPVVVMNVGGGDASFQGCIQPSFPADQPDLSAISPPEFATENTNGQLVAQPGTPLEAQITVNRATRYALVELQQAWSESPPAVATELQTSGGERLDFTLFSAPDQRFGRYYMKITLCGFDCDEQMVVFDVNPDVNSPYGRTVIEEGEVVQEDATCVDMLPRATVLIQ